MADRSSEARYETAGDVLNGLRAQLSEQPQDEMKLLLSIFDGLSNLNTDGMSPGDAARWLFRPQTKWEKRIGEIASRKGFNKGAAVGALIAFLLCAFVVGFVSAISH
jgi:hypothetical protein